MSNGIKRLRSLTIEAEPSLLPRRHSFSSSSNETSPDRHSIEDDLRIEITPRDAGRTFEARSPRLGALYLPTTFNFLLERLIKRHISTRFTADSVLELGCTVYNTTFLHEWRWIGH